MAMNDGGEDHGTARMTKGRDPLAQFTTGRTPQPVPHVVAAQVSNGLGSMDFAGQGSLDFASIFARRSREQAITVR